MKREAAQSILSLPNTTKIPDWGLNETMLTNRILKSEADKYNANYAEKNSVCGTIRTARLAEQSRFRMC